MFSLDPWVANGVCLDQHNLEFSWNEDQSSWTDGQMDEFKVPRGYRGWPQPLRNPLAKTYSRAVNRQTRTWPQPTAVRPKAQQNTPLTGDTGEKPPTQSYVLLSTSGGLAYYGLYLLSVSAEKHTQYTVYLSAWELHAVFKQIIKARVRGSRRGHSLGYSLEPAASSNQHAAGYCSLMCTPNVVQPLSLKHIFMLHIRNYPCGVKCARVHACAYVCTWMSAHSSKTIANWPTVALPADMPGCRRSVCTSTCLQNTICISTRNRLRNYIERQV